MNAEKTVCRLEVEWGDEGFLGRVRQGEFRPEGARAFLDFLRGIDLSGDTLIPKRLLSLSWYLPGFLEWQRERVRERGGDPAAYARFVTEVTNILEEVLGVP